MLHVGRVSGVLGRIVPRAAADLIPISQGHGVPGLGGVWMQGQGHRFYKKKNSIRMPPTKPINLSHSGDRTTDLDALDLTQPTPMFEAVKDLENAPEDVKKLFSLEFADGDVLLERRIRDIRREVQEHPADIASLEVKVAEKTIRLRNAMRHTLQFRKDKVNKSLLFKEIAVRNKLLKQLRDVDYEKFLWICEKLDIVYTPPNPYKDFPLGRRAMRKKVAREQMWKVQEEKLAELEKQLEEEKVVFLKQKEEEMKALEAEMKTLGVTDFTDTETVLKQLLGIEYKPPVRSTKTRRQLILEKKFELYGKLKKKDQTPT